ncbi:MAG: hypothetical protein AAFN13_14130 [Bacteroidota bacterium]
MNGKHGDHPLTDVLHHKAEVFGAEADALIREIDGLGGRSELDHIVGFSYNHNPKHLLARLVPVRDRLRQEAKDRGWEGE